MRRNALLAVWKNHNERGSRELPLPQENRAPESSESGATRDPIFSKTKVSSSYPYRYRLNKCEPRGFRNFLGSNSEGIHAVCFQVQYPRFQSYAPSATFAPVVIRSVERNKYRNQYTADLKRFSFLLLKLQASNGF